MVRATLSIVSPNDRLGLAFSQQLGSSSSGPNYQAFDQLIGE
jgi:hypothetical protein